MNCSTPGLPVHHQLLESTQTHVHWAGDAIQPSHPLSSPSPPALNLSQHQGLFKWVSSLHQVGKVLDWVLTRGQVLFYIFNISFNSFNIKKMRAICRLTARNVCHQNWFCLQIFRPFLTSINWRICSQSTSISTCHLCQNHHLADNFQYWNK